MSFSSRLAALFLYCRPQDSADGAPNARVSDVRPMGRVQPPAKASRPLTASVLYFVTISFAPGADVQNTHTRLSGVLLQIAAQYCCRRRGVSKGDAKVLFFDHTLFYKVQQKRFSLLRLGNDWETGRAGIEPMAEARSPAAFRRIFAFVIQVQESAVDEGVGSASVFIRYRKSGGLVGNQNVAVFINGAQLRPQERNNGPSGLSRSISGKNTHGAAGAGAERKLFPSTLILFSADTCAACRGCAEDTAQAARSPKRGMEASVMTNSRILPFDGERHAARACLSLCFMVLLTEDQTRMVLPPRDFVLASADFATAANRRLVWLLSYHTINSARMSTCI